MNRLNAPNIAASIPSPVKQWLMYALTMLLLAGDLAWDAYGDRGRVANSERDRLQSQVNIIDLNLNSQLLVIDRALRTLRSALPSLQSLPDAQQLVNARLKDIAEVQLGVPTLLLVNADGTCIASNRNELIGQSFRGGERFRTMSKAPDPNKLYISAPFLSPLNTFVISAGKTLQDSHGNFDGYLLAVINPAFFDTLLKSVLYAPDMRAAVIHGQGTVIARVPDPQKLVGINLSQRPGFFTQHLQSGSRTTVQWGLSLASGETRLTVMQSMRGVARSLDYPLVVALSRDPDSIFAEWRRRVVMQGSVFGLLAILVALGMWLYQRRQFTLARIAQNAELSRWQAEETLRASEENLHVTLQSIGDAVIVTDTEGTITNLNPAAEKLTAWPRAEAIGSPLAAVFHIVNAQTRATVTNPAALVIERGETVGLANHTVLIARDGHEYQIADSAAPIRGNDGIVRGVVLVFSDVTRQYAIQDELRQREALLSTLTQRANIGMIMITPDHRYVFANETYGRLFNLDIKDIMDRHAADVWPEMYESHFRAYFDRAFSGERATHEFTQPAAAGDRENRWYEISCEAPVETAHGLCMIGLITDITPRKVAAQALAQLAAIVEHTNDAIVVRDPNGAITSWNAAAERLFGWSAEEAAGRPFRVLLSATPESSRRYRFERVLRGETVSTAEDIRRCKSGATLAVETTMSAVRNADGNIVAVSSIMRDISARKQAEEARNALAAIVESAHDAIYSRSLDGRILTWNRGAEKMFGYTPAEAIGKSVTFTLAPSEQSNYSTNNERLLRGETFSREMRRVTKDGREITVLASLSPIKNTGGVTVNVSTIMHDITALRRAQASSTALEAQLREAQKMQAIGTLAGGIAHDFNNIIATISGNAQLALEDQSSRSKITECIQEIQKASARASTLVRQILSFSRRQPTQMQLIALEPVIQEGARLLRATLPQRITLEVLCGGGTPRVRADATLIEQVVLNLCTNAMHAIPDRAGRITITLETAMLNSALAEAIPSLKHLCQRWPGRAASIAVSDTGIGMDATTVSRIFEPFFTTKAVNEGTGLGLSVVHGIVDAHQGAIVVESEPGKGSTFSIFIPEATGAHSLEADRLDKDTHKTNQHTRAKLNILHIDDDPALASVTATLLGLRGFNVKSFTDPRDALWELQTHPGGYDIVLTDYNMPHMSGIDVAQKSQSIRRDIAVVVASGFIDNPLLAQANSAGVRKIISKDVTPDELAEILHQLVDSQ